MGGYRLRRGGATGVHDELYASCAVINDGQTEIALLSLDLLCLPHTVVDHIKAGIFAQTKIPSELTLIACTHTHSGPGTLGLSGGSAANDEYLASLSDVISSLVAAAQGRLSQVNISIVQVDIPDIAFNRRLKLKDGSSAINIDRIDPQEIAEAGETDPCGTAIFFEADTHTAGIIVNFTLHPTVLGEHNYLYSRDYPGYLVDYLQEDLPDQPVSLFFNGAFGNINQIKLPGEWIATFQEAQSIGEAIARQILMGYSSRTTVQNTEITASSKTIQIPLRLPESYKYPDRPDATESYRTRPSETHHSPEKENIFKTEAQHLHSMAPELAELQVFQLGEIELIALPGEIFVELGLEIKKRSASPYSVIVGNANGYIGYVPTESSFHEGGYETRLSLTSRLDPKAGEILLTNIDQVRNQK
jgi:hypothetical protein